MTTLSTHRPLAVVLAAGLLSGHNEGPPQCAPTGARSMPTAQPEEADLVRRSQAGEAAAFQALTVRYYRPVSAFLLKRVGRVDVVEDLAQDTFLAAFRSLGEGAGPQHFSSWLFGIAHNLAGKWLRRKRPVLFDPHEAPDLASPPDRKSVV